jgi:hypothetical protein
VSVFSDQLDERLIIEEVEGWEGFSMFSQNTPDDVFYFVHINVDFI